MEREFKKLNSREAITVNGFRVRYESRSWIYFYDPTTGEGKIGADIGAASFETKGTLSPWKILWKKVSIALFPDQSVFPKDISRTDQDRIVDEVSKGLRCLGFEVEVLRLS